MSCLNRNQKITKYPNTACEGKGLVDQRIVTVKLPDEVYQEMALRIPEGDRSDFIREAIAEKLQKTPKADKLLALETAYGRSWRRILVKLKNTSPT